jgi:hypothetical protein
VYGVGDLELGIENFERVTGVRPVAGGKHAGLGTHNAIFSLGDDAYFEIIAPDPSQADACPTPKWMGMDTIPKEFLQCGRLLTWAVRLAGAEGTDPEAFEASVRAAGEAGYHPGEVCDFSRKPANGTPGQDDDMLRWSLAYNHFTWPLPGAGIVPFLIRWDPQSMRSVNDAAPAGCTLVGMEGRHPDAAAAREINGVLRRLGGVRELPEGVDEHRADAGAGAAGGAGLFGNFGGASGVLGCVLDTPNGRIAL